ncbi:amino acid ABC transporter ATP-binding protein [Campylobacter lanienae]|uniref:amino acid ABC transporter ATP-binding protein n=1 Tax=Campylobacter lanienae TaxID=75658 RepID=UPI002A91F31E|nr:amino acid ABC transporter ATP-binding protein [Campylobacter lanienae]MDY6135435.1 amino acid ABC transporter ATP-binding protein [Campylobacter lanienae]
MLQIKDINKQIASHTILSNISFDIKKGEIIAIIGPSGSGKTTLLRSLNYLEAPDSGILEFSDGSLKIDFKQHPNKQEILNLRRKMGMVFQSYNLFAHLNATQNITQGLISVQKIPKEKAIDIALNLLNKFGLKDRANAYPSSLSGGQQQRVAIARAMALKPDILLLDEPTSALDKELVSEVLSTLKMLANEHQTMILVTHELKFAKDIADKIIFLEGGKIITIQPPKEFFEAQDNPRIIKFIGDLHC